MACNDPIMKIYVAKGDITKLAVDAIVNAANSSLLGGGGVDGAIHRAGGRAILDECVKIRNRQGGCAPGQAVSTTAGNMKARHVIHTVGPVWTGGEQGEAAVLESCYRNSLRLAVENGDRTVAFPCISTGIYGYPQEEAAQIAVRTVSGFLQEDESLQAVVFICFNEDSFALYQKAVHQTWSQSI